MILMAIILAVWAGLIGYCNSVMDKLAHHYSTSRFSQKKNQLWWDPDISWRNKYKDGDPDKGPKFFGSTTFLVFTTDAWHFYKWLMNGLIYLPPAFIFGFLLLDGRLMIVAYIGLRIVYAVTFHVFYHYIYAKKDNP